MAAGLRCRGAQAFVFSFQPLCFYRDSASSSNRFDPNPAEPGPKRKKMENRKPETGNWKLINWPVFHFRFSVSCFSFLYGLHDRTQVGQGARMRHVWRGRVTEVAPVALGMLFLLTACVFRLHVWRSVYALLPAAPAEFAQAFAALNAHQIQILFPLGMVTTIAIVIVLVRQGAGSAAGRLRMVAIVALVLSSVVSTTATDPLQHSIVATLPLTGADGIGPLLQSWTRWQWVHCGLALVVGGALLVAHRLPAAPAATHAGGLTARHRSVLFVLGAATLFEGYDRFIVSLALPYIGKDLGASEGQLGYALSLIRVGALLSVLLGKIADRFGRRRLLLISVMAYTVATAATGLSRGLVTFVTFQLAANIFLVAELALAQVVIAEEFPAEWRGRGQGMLGAFGALGAGMAAILFPVMQRTSIGWRGLYLIGIVPLLLITYLQRALPETQRWEGLRAARAAREPHAQAFTIFPRGLRGRLCMLMLIAAAATFAGGSAFGFMSFRATNDFGWPPAKVSTMIITGGGIGFWGWFVFGRLVDVFGRRAIGAISLIGSAAAIVAFYRTSWLLVSFTGVVFLEAGAAIAINALGTELFPTHVRATAKAWITNAGIIGAMLGLATVGRASAALGGIEVVIPLLAIAPVLAAPLLFLLPETGGRELELLA
jgi:putative MFS transporter